VALAAMVLLAACAEQTGTTQLAECATAESRLAALGVDRSEIVSVLATADRAHEGSGVLARHAWVRLRSYDGYIVVRTDTGCSHNDAYATGNCRLPERSGSRAGAWGAN